MRSIREAIAVEAPPERVWAVLGDPAAASRYVPGIARSRMEGAVRVCEMADGQEIREVISDLVPERRSYRYQHVKTPMPVRLSRGRFWVEAAGPRSRVQVEAEVEALDPGVEPGLAEMMTAGLRQTLQNLKALLEKGP